MNNIVLADKTAIGAMKMEVMLRRSKFRDFYDIYSLLQSGESLDEMIGIAIKYSGHRLKSKNLIAMLTRPGRFVMEPDFAMLRPVYDVSAQDIIDKIVSELTL